MEILSQLIQSRYVWLLLLFKCRLMLFLELCCLAKSYDIGMRWLNRIARAWLIQPLGNQLVNSLQQSLSMTFLASGFGCLSIGHVLC